MRARPLLLLFALPLVMGAQQPAPPASAPAAPPASSAAPEAPPPEPPPEAPPAAPPATPAEMLEHADDVADYTMRAKLDPSAHVVHGEGTIVWRNTSRTPVRELWLHLYLNAFKNEKSVFMREPVGGFRGVGRVKDWGSIDVRKLELRGEGDLLPAIELHRPGDDDETDARVPLPREIAPGESLTLDMAWDDKLPTVIERTGYDGSFHMVGQWFPKVARLEEDGTWAHFPFHHLAEFYADYGTYDVTIDVPDDFTIGASGPAVSSVVENGRRVERHVQGDVHDFAWTAWDKWQSMKEKIDGVDVTVLFPPGFRVVAQRELATVRFAIPYFGERYGRYPYGVLTLVHPPSGAREAGGMEYPTLITTGFTPWFGPPGVMVPEYITIHEFGHQWFYGLLGSNEEAWPFLDEGLNSFAEQDGLRHMLGAGSFVDLLGLTVADSAQMAAGSRTPALNEPVAQAAPDFESGGDYGALVYSRTATILETLRRVYGDDAMMRAMQTYARRFRFRHPTPYDFEAAIGDVLGESVRATLHTALFEKGWVDYAVGSVSSKKVRPPAGLFDRGGKRETVDYDTAGDGSYESMIVVWRRGTLSFPVTIELTLDDGSTETREWDGKDEATRVVIVGKKAVRAAVVDPGHAVLVDQNLTNNHGSTPDGRRSATRTFERALYWAELLVQAVSP